MAIETDLSKWLPWIRLAVTDFNRRFPDLSWGTYPGHDPSENRAEDGMVPNWQTAAGKARGWDVAKQLWADRKKYNIWYIIFDEKIISQTRPEQGWIRYTPTAAAVRKSEASAKHWNHVHVSHYAGDPGGLPPLAPPAGTVWVDLLVPGVTDSDSVRLVQRALGIEQTGAYDDATQAAAKTFQKSLGDDVQDGLLGPKQTQALFERAGIPVTIRLDASGEAPKPVAPEPEPTPEPKPEPKPDPEPKPVTVTETVCGWNILRRTDTEPGRKRWPERKPLIGKTLRSIDASVYLLVETDSTTRKDCGAELGGDFTWWGYKYYGVYWNQNIWERVGDAANEFEFRDNNNRFLLSIPLRHKASGKIVTFDCTHLENDGDAATDGHKARYVEATHITEKARSGSRVGYFDCNSTTPAVISKPSAREKQKPRYVMAQKMGAKFLSSLGSSKVKNYSSGTHHGGKGGTKGPLIDDVWVVGDVTILDGEFVRTDSTDASDHNALKARIRF